MSVTNTEKPMLLWSLSTLDFGYLLLYFSSLLINVVSVNTVKVVVSVSSVKQLQKSESKIWMLTEG